MGKYLIFLAPLARVHVCMGAWVQAHECTHMRACTHTYAVSQTHTHRNKYTLQHKDIMRLIQET